MKTIKRFFTENNQIDFSNISGDYNPIHLDKTIARRSLFGRPIVHGMHLVLWSINEQGKTLPKRSLSLIDVQFFQSVPENEEVGCFWENNKNSSQISLIYQKQVAVKIKIEWQFDENIFDNCTQNSCPPYEEPISPDKEKLLEINNHLELFCPQEKIKFLLPDLLNKLQINQVAYLLALTRLVGNKCPGLNSIFTGFSLKFFRNTDIERLNYKIESFDERFGAINIQIKGASCNGSVKAYFRPSQISQKPFSVCQSFVKEGEFENVKALVIGGSRGLGEVATKLLSAGGAKVTFTYLSGETEAKKIVQEINSNSERVNAIQFDVSNFLPSNLPEVNFLVYMTTPFIFSAVKGQFNNDLFMKFSSHYVQYFSRICSSLFLNNGLRRVLYPSSVAISELPTNMGEYAAAKAAAEITCKFLEKTHPNLLIHSPRLNRLETDQTVSVLPQKIEDPIPVILKELRIALKEI